MSFTSAKFTHFRGYRANTVMPTDEAMTGIVGRSDMVIRPSSKYWPTSLTTATLRAMLRN